MTKIANRCSVCQKQLGTSYCTGCGVYFCTKDFKSHREILSSGMDAVITHRNDLQGKITKATQRYDPHSPLIAQIDEWQRVMIEKIKLVAENTRQQISQLLNSKRVKLNNDFRRFSHELVNLKETENFVEHDLSRLKQMIHKFNLELKQLTKPLTVELHTEQSNRIVWNQLIYAEEKSTYAGIQQRQQQVKGMLTNYSLNSTNCRSNYKKYDWIALFIRKLSSQPIYKESKPIIFF
jgi:hypothetical protein